MDKRIRKVETLLISDIELECNCDSLTIDDINITHIGFSSEVINKYDMIIYEGDKGTKILKSTYTKTGKVE